MTKLAKLMTGAALAFAVAAPAAADELTVVSFGGAYGAAQYEHMIKPFEEATGHTVLFEDYSGGIAEVKAQVEAGNVQWDVVDFEVIDLERACSEGLVEYIDFDQLPPGADGTPADEDFFPQALENDCGVGIMFWAWSMPTTPRRSVTWYRRRSPTSSTPRRSRASARCAGARR